MKSEISLDTGCHLTSLRPWVKSKWFRIKKQNYYLHTVRNRYQATVKLQLRKESKRSKRQNLLKFFFCSKFWSFRKIFKVGGSAGEAKGAKTCPLGAHLNLASWPRRCWPKVICRWRPPSLLAPQRADVRHHRAQCACGWGGRVDHPAKCTPPRHRRWSRKYVPMWKRLHQAFRRTGDFHRQKNLQNTLISSSAWKATDLSRICSLAPLCVK